MNDRKRDTFIISEVSSSNTNVITSDLGAFLRSDRGQNVLKQAQATNASAEEQEFNTATAEPKAETA